LGGALRRIAGRDAALIVIAVGVAVVAVAGLGAMALARLRARLGDEAVRATSAETTATAVQFRAPESHASWRGRRG